MGDHPDDEDDAELRELAKLDKLKEMYGSTMSQASYNARLKAIMVKYTKEAKGEVSEGVGEGKRGARARFLWGVAGGCYEKTSKKKEYANFEEAKAMLKEIEDKEWDRDTSAPGNQQWRRFIYTIGKVTTRVKITYQSDGTFKAQVGKMQVDVTEEEKEDDAEEDEEKKQEKDDDDDEEPEKKTSGPGRSKRERKKKKPEPESSEPAPSASKRAKGPKK